MNRNGNALLVMMLAVLCLSVFTLISFVQIRTDDRITQTGAQMFKAYYAADAYAEHVVDILLTANAEHGTLPESVLGGTDIRSGTDPLTGAQTAAFVCPVTDEKEIYIQVVIFNDGYDIEAWKLRDVEDWEFDSDLPVWQGEEGID